MSHYCNNKFWRDHLKPRLALLKDAKIVKAKTEVDEDGNLWVSLYVAIPSEKGRVHKITITSDGEGNRPGFLQDLPDPPDPT